MFKQEQLTKTTISKTRVVDSNLSSGMSKIEYKNFLRFFDAVKAMNFKFSRPDIDFESTNYSMLLFDLQEQQLS